MMISLFVQIGIYIRITLRYNNVRNRNVVVRVVLVVVQLQLVVGKQLSVNIGSDIRLNVPKGSHVFLPAIGTHLGHLVNAFPTPAAIDILLYFPFNSPLETALLLFDVCLELTNLHHICLNLLLESTDSTFPDPN